jgi:hypothetical protein
MGEGGQRQAPAVYTPRKETRHPSYRRLGRSQGRSGRLRKISPRPGFDPRTVQPGANRYTDWAIPAFLPPDATSENPTFSSQTISTCWSDVKKNWNVFFFFFLNRIIPNLMNATFSCSRYVSSVKEREWSDFNRESAEDRRSMKHTDCVNGQFPSTPAVCAGF